MDKRRKSSLKPQDVVALYTIQHFTMEEIGKLAGVTRQSIRMVLIKKRISPQQGEWVTFNCDFCGKESKKTRGYWRKRIHNYCSNECYYASIENPGYYQSRQGQRIARAIVNQYFRLEPEHIVHHKDGDTRHNDLINLAVYASHSDHLKATHHHNGNVKPIWDGATP